MDYMVSLQVLLGKVYLVVHLVTSARIWKEVLDTLWPIWRLPRETFYSWTCVAMDYMVSLQVQLEKVSLVVHLATSARIWKEALDTL